MFKIIPLLILASILAYSCSSSDTKKSGEKTASSSEEVSSEDGFGDDGFGDDDLDNDDGFGDDDFDKEVSSTDDNSSKPSVSDEMVASTSNTQEDELIIDDELDNELDAEFEDEVSEEFADADSFDEEDSFGDFESDSKRSVSSAVTIGGEVASRSVGRGETLMLMAFNIYGDYTKWKLIRDLNPGVDINNLRAGQKIKYQVPNRPFTWSPNGQPYLIKRGDTLGKISRSKYGTSKKWRSIYENNRPMIKNPDLIFAGFTLYYIDGESDFAFNN